VNVVDERFSTNLPETHNFINPIHDTGSLTMKALSTMLLTLVDAASPVLAQIDEDESVKALLERSASTII
jgi:hypothetical protein